MLYVYGTLNKASELTLWVLFLTSTVSSYCLEWEEALLQYWLQQRYDDGKCYSESGGWRCTCLWASTNPLFFTLNWTALTCPCNYRILHHHHHHQVRVAGEGRRVVASPCPRSTERLRRSPFGRVESFRSWLSHLFRGGRPGGRRHVRSGSIFAFC